jgi:hypothetical protein
MRKNASRQGPLIIPLGTLLRCLGVCQVFESGIDNREKEERIRRAVTFGNADTERTWIRWRAPSGNKVANRHEMALCIKKK